jgi:hypothetical protein
MSNLVTFKIHQHELYCSVELFNYRLDVSQKLGGWGGGGYSWSDLVCGFRQLDCLIFWTEQLKKKTN